MRRLTLVAILLLWVCATVMQAQDDIDADEENAPPPIRVWLPAPLTADESGAAFQLLSEHAVTFRQNNGVSVQLRIKEVAAPGGIMATIRAGKEVAPDALPDLALIRRRDLSPAQAQQYLQSLETLFSSSLINDLGNGLPFGQVRLEDGATLYGLPYLFDLLLTVISQPAAPNEAGLSYADVLNSGATFYFPAARSTGLNQTVYLQYLAAGGLTLQDESVTVDESALRTVLSFYEALVRQGQLSADVLTYQSPAAYRSEFIGQVDQSQLAVFTASDFLQMIGEQDAPLIAANIPTSDGEGLSLREAWLWVLVTPDLSRQAASARFLEWMMEPGFHAAFARAVHHLPSQPGILKDSLPAMVDSQLFMQLLANATLPSPENEGGTIPRLIQESLAQVLQGAASASEATRQVLDQLAQR